MSSSNMKNLRDFDVIGVKMKIRPFPSTLHVGLTKNVCDYDITGAHESTVVAVLSGFSSVYAYNLY